MCPASRDSDMDFSWGAPVGVAVLETVQELAGGGGLDLELGGEDIGDRHARTPFPEDLVFDRHGDPGSARGRCGGRPPGG